MAGDAPYASLGDLGIDMRLGEDLGMPPTDAGVKRAIEEMVAELLTSSDDSDSEEMETEDEVRASR